MDKSSLKIYFKYVRDVLGIKQIFSKSSLIEAHPTEDVTVLIAVKSLKTYSLDENILLEKMISALKLEAAQILIIDLAEVAPMSRYRLNFVDDIQERFENDVDLFVTWSPRHLLQNPALKKEAWAVMQNLLQKINP